MSVRSVVVALVAAATVVVAGCVPDRPDRMDPVVGADTLLPHAPMDSADCTVVLVQLVEARGRRGSTIRGAGPPGSVSSPVRVPVGDIGDWVVRTPEGQVLFIEDGRPAVVCGDRRMPEGPSSSALPQGAQWFTDADLRAAVRGHETAVALYVWSPHMPLSVDGYAEIIAAAEGRGVAVVPLLFAQADTDFARREAARVGMPKSALRTLAASELLLRDAQVHAPSVIVFRGREASPVMPGYRNAEGYGRWLDVVLSRRGPRPGRAP